MIIPPREFSNAGHGLREFLGQLFQARRAQKGDFDVMGISNDTSGSQDVTGKETNIGLLTNGKPKSARWIGACSAALFCLFILYYQSLLIAILQLVQLSWWLATKPAPGPSLAAFDSSILIVSLIVLIMIRLVAELWTGVISLVSNRFEAADDPDAAVPQATHSAPRLHSLIADVGRQINSPVPDRVCITPRAECYVSEQRRFGLTTQRELTLVLGLPHLSALSTTELRVIIAHELAHFRSGDTRLGVFLFRFLEALRAANQQTQQRIAWIDPIFWYRWLYFHISWVLAAPIFKHQELHADSVSASVHGGELTARTLLREWLLAHQFESLLENYRQSGTKPPDGENLFEESGRRFRRFSPAAHDYLRLRLATVERSSLFDSHPTMRDRVETVGTYPDRDLPESQLGRDLVPDLAKLQKEFHEQLVRC